MRDLFDKSKPAEDRLAKLEVVATRLARRAKKVASAIITPYSISSCTIGEDIKGDILRYMFCSKGVIKKCLISLGNKPTVGVSVTISISNDAGGGGKNYAITKKTSIFEPNIDVYSGDRLSVSIIPVDQEKDKVTEVWIALTWIPDIKDVEVKQYLIDSLDEAESDISKE